MIENDQGTDRLAKNCVFLNKSLEERQSPFSSERRFP